MYRLLKTSQFEKSYDSIKRSGKLKELAKAHLAEAINLLLKGEKLPPKYKDHQLIGDLKDRRECHIKGDLLLVYQIRKTELILLLVDIGTHSYLGF